MIKPFWQLKTLNLLFILTIKETNTDAEFGGEAQTKAKVEKEVNKNILKVDTQFSILGKIFDKYK